LAPRPLAVGGGRSRPCAIGRRPEQRHQATEEHWQEHSGRAALRLHAAPHQPPHLAPAGPARRPERRHPPRAGDPEAKRTTRMRATLPCAWSRPRVVDPAVDGLRWRHPRQVVACAPIYTPTTSSRRRRVRRIQPDTSIMRATDNHHADRRAGHVSCGPFDQPRRDGAADPARGHGLAVRNSGLRSIPPPVPMAASWW
jgi:hypothetical protein